MTIINQHQSRMNMHQKYKLITIVLLCVLNTTFSYGQDMHFTNYGITPGYFNPALNGNFSGTVRAGLIFRDQHEWSKVTNATPYRTFGLGVDAPLVYGLRKNHWIGVGLGILNDRVGIDGNEPTSIVQKWSRFVPSVSYHIGLDKKFRNVVSFGIQYGLTSVTYDGTDAWTENRYINGVDQQDLGDFTMDGISGSYGSINFGVTYKSILDKTSSFEVGAAMMHLQNPSFMVKGGNASTVYRRANIHGVYRVATTKRWTIEPALYASIGLQSNIQAQFRTDYLTKPKGDVAIIMGVGYRLGDAAQILTGARYKDYLISLSYDYALTNAAEISPHKLELGVARLFTFNKRPDPKPIMYCPRL